MLIIAVMFIVSTLPAGATPFTDELEDCAQRLSLGVTPQIAAQTNLILDRDLDETEKLAEDIAEIARLRSSEFVMVGRSPSMLAALFEAQSLIFRGLQTWVLPISLKNTRLVPTSILASRFVQLESVFREVSALPLPQVYIDAVSEGRTLITLDRILVSLNRKALLIGFSDDVQSAEQQFKKAHVVNPYKILPVSHAYMSHLAEHKALAPYNSFPIEEFNPDLKKAPAASPRFLDLRLQIQKRLNL